MRFTVISVLPFCVLIACCAEVCAKVCTAKCPRGGKIYARGTNDAERQTIVNIHNKYRKMILTGKVPNQPRAKAMKMLVYDKLLERLARNVTQTCKMEHVQVGDKRWKFLGQNLYIERSSKKCKGQNWEKAITKWFDEHKFYKYPSEPNRQTGHYTQLITHNSSVVGCDFIFFYDASKPTKPYSKLYACNYGPPGNVEGIPPYETV